jgi:predicted transporter
MFKKWFKQFCITGLEFCRDFIIMLLAFILFAVVGALIVLFYWQIKNWFGDYGLMASILISIILISIGIAAYQEIKE